VSGGPSLVLPVPEMALKFCKKQKEKNLWRHGKGHKLKLFFNNP
jgi:hypothetical protein